MDNKFFTLIKPYLDYIDSGKLYKQPFQILYQIIAVLMLLFPLAVLVVIFQMGISFGLIMMWLALAAGGWFSFQLWWERGKQLTQTSSEGDDFIATPVVSNLIQTFGEWLGSYMASVGTLLTLFMLIFGGDLIPREISSMGALGLVYFPLAGFVCIIFHRWIAEMIRALVAIANNTRK